MNKISVASPAILAILLALSAPSMAQTTIGAQTVTDIDLPAVEDHCALLAAKGDTTAGVTGNANATTGASPATGEGRAAVRADARADLDIAAITLDECTAAGIGN